MPAETARLLSLAFDPEVRTPQDAVYNQILDAALALAAASGLRHLTMDDVARRAGVGRMTVYRRFGSKSALIDALAIRECRRCLSIIAEALDPQTSFLERSVALFITVLKVIREHPLLARLARVEPEAFLNELTRDGSAIFLMVREFLVGVVMEAQRQRELIPGDPSVLAELGLRLGVSFVLMPDSVLPVDDEPATRATLTDLLQPLLPPPS
jgi:AcrR family transcriptional regulator